MQRPLHINLLQHRTYTQNARLKALSLVPRVTRAASTQLSGPPGEFDTSFTRDATSEIVNSHFPDLLDLVEDGGVSLLAHTEMRTDAAPLCLLTGSGICRLPCSGAAAE